MSSSIPAEKKSEISSSAESSFDIGTEDICSHPNSMESGGIQICTSCGLELNSDINQSKNKLKTEDINSLSHEDKETGNSIFHSLTIIL
jgi:hypothetical protein